MQKYVTPAPGRTSRTRIIQREDYQLDVKVTEVVGDQWRLQILRYMPETDWTTTEFYLTGDELELFKQSLNAGR